MSSNTLLYIYYELILPNSVLTTSLHFNNTLYLLLSKLNARPVSQRTHRSLLTSQTCRFLAPSRRPFAKIHA